MIKILIPLDGSAVAEEALHHAIAIASVFPAELTLLRAITEPNRDASVHMDCVDFALLRHQAEAYLDDLATKYANDKLSIRGEVAEGRSANTIVHYANKNKPDLLVLSRYGRGNAKNYSVGGTAQKIVTSVHCSVLLVDPGTGIEAGKSYSRIFIPIYDGKESDGVVAVGAMIAETHNASLLLLHVCDEPQLPRSLPATSHARRTVDEMRKIVRDGALQRLDALTRRIPDSVTVEKRVLISTDPSLAIEATAADYGCDLLLLHSMNNCRDYGRYHSAINQSLIRFSRNSLFILQSSGIEGFASNFRSVYLEEQGQEAG
jgi:nucleotide-binding universal stress UspA family protein